MQGKTKATLTLRCYKCTREHIIGCDSPTQGAAGANVLGWAQDDKGPICPDCSKPEELIYIHRPKSERRAA